MKSLLLFIMLTSCQSVLNDANSHYRKTLQVGLVSSPKNGFTVLPKSDHYDLQFGSTQHPEMIRITNCHRDIFLVRKLGKNVRYSYTPAKGIEDSGSCIMQILSLDDKGRHQFGAIDFADDETLPAKIYCNAEMRESSGVSVCQAKTSTLQVLEFDEPVKILAADGCKHPTSRDRKLFKYVMSPGYCIFLFSRNGERHRHTSFGYDGDMGK